MKTTPQHVGILILILCGLLAACTGTPPDDEVLPTLAQLPTIIPTVTSTPVLPNTPIAPKNTAPASETAITPNPIILPDPLLPTATAASVDNFGLDVFPEFLEVGTQITLQGTLTSEDTNSGVALLTNDNGQTINLLVDPFTAMTANNQLVQIRGKVEQQAGSEANAVRVSEIRMMNGSSALPTATDAQAGLELTAVPDTGS